MKLYGRCSDLDTAFHVVESYPNKYNFKLNAQVYTCLMSACIANTALPHALEVFAATAAVGPVDLCRGSGGRVLLRWEGVLGWLPMCRLSPVLSPKIKCLA